LCCIFIEIEILLKLDPRTDPFDQRDQRGGGGGGPIYLIRVRMWGELTRSTANAGLCERVLCRADRPAYPPLILRIPSLIIFFLSNQYNCYIYNFDVVVNHHITWYVINFYKIKNIATCHVNISQDYHVIIFLF